MKKYIRVPSPSMVVACIALFAALSGTAIAATVAKNSVGSKQLKKNAVINSKIKSSAVTGAKVKNDSLTGSDINESTLGTVPSATTAQSAQTAQTAASVSGVRVVKFEYNGSTDATPSAFFNEGGLKLTGSCAAGDTGFIGETSVNDAVLHWGVQTFNGVSTVDEGVVSSYEESDDLDTGEDVDFTQGSNTLPIDLSDSTQGTFSYTNPSGSIVTGTFMVETDSTLGGRPGVCHVFGTATVA